MNEGHENCFAYQIVGVMFKKDTHFKPNLVSHIELHTTANVVKEHVESIFKKEIQPAVPS